MRYQIAGVYVIVNRVNGKRYIGSSVNVMKCWAAHRSLLTRGKHTSRHLQAAWDKYGAAAFELVVVEEVFDVSLLLKREQVWLDASRSFVPVFGYNVAAIAGAPTLGREMPAEVRAKISASNKGKVRTAETKARIGAASRVRVHSPETCAKRGASNRGRVVSAQTRQRISTARLALYRQRKLGSDLVGGVA